MDGLAALMQAHVDAGLRLIDSAGISFAGREIIFELDMAYLGQTHTVAVPLPVALDAAHNVAPTTREAIQAAFDTAYERVYGRLLPGGVTRVLNLRSAVIGQRPKFDLATLAAGARCRCRESWTRHATGLCRGRLARSGRFSIVWLCPSAR